jgi:SAM-dependent methyltransferase
LFCKDKGLFPFAYRFAINSSATGLILPPCPAQPRSRSVSALVGGVTFTASNVQLNRISPVKTIQETLNQYLRKLCQMSPIDQSLLLQAHKLLDDPKVSVVLNSQCENGLGEQNNKLVTAIHPADQMLTHSIRILADVNQSVSQYFCVALQQYRAQQRMLQLAFPEGFQDRLILDFACGYGRALRFLVQSYPPGQIWASDIQEDAVAFVGDKFGVNTLVSEVTPAQFQPGRKFSFIWVASLFTHLPERLFRAWLVRLHELLADDGYLIFSVHDEAILPAGVQLGANGLLFKPESEISELDSAVYGTTHVSESFVRSMLAQDLAQVPGNYMRIPRGLADQQDLYIVPKHQQSLERFSGYRQGAWGWVECAMAYGVTKDAPTVLAYVSGWAKSLDRDAVVTAVYAEVDGVRYQAALGIRRPDLANAWGGEFENYGWELRFPIAKASTSFVSVMAQLDNGESGLIYFGTLDPTHLLKRAPWGHLDKISIQGSVLHMGGWAGVSSGETITKIVATIGRAEYEAVLGDPRQDVCDALKDQGYQNSGWQVNIPASGLRFPVQARIVASAGNGEKRTLFEGLVNPDSN